MKKLIFCTILFFILSGIVLPRPFRVSQIPNGSVNGCANCHVNPAGGGPRNDFGKLVEKKFLTAQGASGQVEWGPVLASYDADGDGISNGSELQDPQGLWASGQPAPGSSSLVTSPANFINSPAFAVDILFLNMTPHFGQKFELRVVDKFNLREIDRVTLPSISGDFSFSLDGILPDHSYWIDFYADHNGNGFYDSPPVDHAWRLELNNPSNEDSVTFSHNTNFTEINWPNLLMVAFSGMTPHIGQMLELRVIDDESGIEVGRQRIESITGADFNIRLPGVQAGKEYNIQFYADHNANGLYDAPPADHAWEIKFNNSTGDTVIPFAHNTNFTDVNWKYNLVFNFTGMTPHLGQQLSARVIHTDHPDEAGRVIITAITSANFMITIPGLELNHNYMVDFYADHNGNKMYDAPPVDHAWRDSFTTSDNGDFAVTFSHNTNFTDINWPNTTDVEKTSNIIPSEFALLQNFPNPFNPSTTIRFNLIEDGFTTLKIYNIMGEEIATLIKQNLNAGSYDFNWNAAGIESGVYFYRLQTENVSETRKMILLK